MASTALRAWPHPVRRQGLNILTHCNAGSLATAFYGTALGVVYAAAQEGLINRVYADETRPVNQGARLTAWELARAGVPVTLQCDDMAASLMAEGKVDAVIVGADRIAANRGYGQQGGHLGAGDHGSSFPNSVLCGCPKKHHRLHNEDRRRHLH